MKKGLKVLLAIVSFVVVTAAGRFIAQLAIEAIRGNAPPPRKTFVSYASTVPPSVSAAPRAFIPPATAPAIPVRETLEECISAISVSRSGDLYLLVMPKEFGMQSVPYAAKFASTLDNGDTLLQLTAEEYEIALASWRDAIDELIPGLLQSAPSVREIAFSNDYNKASIYLYYDAPSSLDADVAATEQFIGRYAWVMQAISGVPYEDISVSISTTRTRSKEFDSPVTFAPSDYFMP